MPENDPRRYGYGGLASHVEGVGNHAVVFAQSSVLSTQSLFFLNPKIFELPPVIGHR
jgi:hypothetical protein